MRSLLPFSYNQILLPSHIARTYLEALFESFGSMLSKLVGWLAGPRAMEVQINLDEGRTVYSSGDTVAGEIMLLAESSMHVSSIVIILSGIAVSRSKSGKNCEVHQVCP